MSAISGAEKIRWNAALASTRVLKICQFSTSETGVYITTPLVTALTSTFADDKYFKVRAHAGLSLMLLFENTLDGSLSEDKLSSMKPAKLLPMLQFSGPIIEACMAFLSTDPRLLIDNGTTEAQQHITICFLIGSLLLLHCAIYSLSARGNEQARKNLKLIGDGLDDSNLAENLSNSWQYAKDAKLAAFSVTRGAKSKRGSANMLYGLARLADQPVSEWIPLHRLFRPRYPSLNVML